jgi:hypothetical protein
MLSKRISTMLLSGAAAAAMTTAAHASLTMDVRATSVTGAGNSLGNNKLVNLAGPGTVTFDIFATINPTTDNGNTQDEAFVSMTGSFLSTGAGVLGDMAATVNAAGGYYNPPQSSFGTITDLDGDGDLDVGGASSSSGADYWWARAANVATGVAGQSHLLGTLTLVITSVGATDTTVNYQKKLGAPSGVGQWRENNGPINGSATNILIGSNVVLHPNVPEPTSVGLIGLAGLGMFARRRK